VSFPISWSLSEFDDLSAADLYAALRLRQRVFVVEQRCAYLDADGVDPGSRHLLGWMKDGDTRELIAYARLLPPGLKYAEPSIGRIVTSPETRRTGAGRDLVRECIRLVESAGWGSAIRIAAQMYPERFYEDFGFRRVSEPYLEDDIWHVDMLRD
jgi:ElaA protein